MAQVSDVIVTVFVCPNGDVGFGLSDCEQPVCGVCGAPAAMRLGPTPRVLQNGDVLWVPANIAIEVREV